MPILAFMKAIMKKKFKIFDFIVLYLILCICISLTCGMDQKNNWNTFAAGPAAANRISPIEIRKNNSK